MGLTWFPDTHMPPWFARLMPPTNVNYNWKGPASCNLRALWWTLPQTCSSGFADEKGFVQRSFCRSHLRYPPSCEADSCPLPKGSSLSGGMGSKFLVLEKQIWEKSRSLCVTYFVSNPFLNTPSQITSKICVFILGTPQSHLSLLFIMVPPPNPVGVPLSFTNY